MKIMRESVTNQKVTQKGNIVYTRNKNIQEKKSFDEYDELIVGNNTDTFSK